MKGQKALFSKASDEWETPQWLFDKLNVEFHFEMDLAANEDNTKCGDFLSKDHDALGNVAWFGTSFLNPPYSKIAAFMKKAYEESLKGAVVVCLIPCRTDTRYWHDYVMRAQEIRFVKGRLKFNGGNYSAPFPSCIVIFDHQLWQGNPYPWIGKSIEQVKK